MNPFNHVKVVSIPTERKHHTRHGLHLNNKGKHWVANNLVKEISNLYLPSNLTPPIVLQWKASKENATQQVISDTSSRMCDDGETSNPGDEQVCGVNIGVRGAQDLEPRNQPTSTSEPTLSASLKQDWPPSWYEQCVDANQSEEVNQADTSYRNSTQNRKIPVTRSTDFLW